MAGKYCLKCKKRMRKALMVTEMIAKWSDEGFYLPDDSNTDLGVMKFRCAVGLRNSVEIEK